MDEFTRTDFLADRLLHEPDELIRNGTAQKELERIVQTLSQAPEIDFEGADRDELIFAVVNHLVENEVSDQYIGLILALIDGGLVIFEKIIQKRREVLASLDEDWREAQVEPISRNYTIEDRNEEFEKINEERKKIQNATARELPGIVDADLKHLAAPFEAAFVRQSFKSEKNWGKLKARLVAMLDAKPGAVAAAKAWRSQSLAEKGGDYSAKDLIEELRENMERAQTKKARAEEKGSAGKKDGPGSAPNEAKVAEEKAGELATTSGPDSVDGTVYQFVPPEDVAYVESLKPASLSLTAEGKISPEVRRWIFGVVLLSPEGEQKGLVPVIAQVIGAENGQVRSSLAHLAPKFRARSAQNNTLVHQQITEIEEYLAQKKRLT